MILVIKDRHDTKNYRLQSFYDFEQRLPTFCECEFYGYDTQNYDRKKTIQDIIKDYDKYPDAIFCMSTLFKMSGWENVQCKKIFLVCDSFESINRMECKFYPGLSNIKWNYVLHNYMYCIDFMKATIPSNWIYFPNWAAECYNYKNNSVIKDIDYLLSGVYSNEYEMRKRFSNAFKSSKFNCIDRFKKKRTNSFLEINKFINLLHRSRYSPHDGGVNGRLVPRYLESCYAKSVIISPYLGKEMDLCGFKHGKNCIIVDRKLSKKKLINTIVEYVEKYSWNTLSENAYNIVKNEHTTDARIKSLLRIVYEN